LGFRAIPAFGISLFALKAAAQQAGVLLPKGACWHCFRRYFATQADRKGMLADDRQRTLGHASAAMTEHYTEADLERRRPYVEQIIKGVLP
jgi:integrase